METEATALTTLGHKIINSFKNQGAQYQRQVLDLIGAASTIKLGTEIDGKPHVDIYSNFHPDFESGIDIGTKTMNGFFLLVWQAMNSPKDLEALGHRVKSIQGGWRFNVSQTDFLEVILPPGRKLNV